MKNEEPVRQSKPARKMTQDRDSVEDCTAKEEAIPRHRSLSARPRRLDRLHADEHEAEQCCDMDRHCHWTPNHRSAIKTERCEAAKKHHNGKLRCRTEPTPTPNCRSVEGQDCPSCRSQHHSTNLPRPPARPRLTAEDPVKPKQPTGIPATVALD